MTITREHKPAIWVRSPKGATITIDGFNYYSSDVDFTKYAVEYSKKNVPSVPDNALTFWSLPCRVFHVETGEEVSPEEARKVLLQMAINLVIFNAEEFLAQAHAMFAEALAFPTDEAI